jgi:ABC-type transport system involved in multi-copper enzyme maturation permease subunit
MTAGLMTPYRSGVRAGRVGFAQLLRAEWTKFRTVRGWVIGMIVAALATVGFGWLTGSGSQCSTMGVSHEQPVSLACTSPLGPGGEAVNDQFYFVHQPLTGAGSITVRMTSLTSGALQPWAKAGIIIKASTKQGSAYAAMLVTGSHGVRLQWNYTQDTAGLPGAVSAAAPRWLRLTRSGDTITGYDSADGARWTEVGAATLAGLPSTVQAGLFATTPHSDTSGHVRAGSDVTTATGGFDHVSRQGTWPGGVWTGADIGAGPLESGADGFQQAGAGFTVTGHGDIAPAVPPDGTATPIGQTLDGVFAGLIAVIVIGAMFITAEYRRGLIRTTLAASPGRGRVLAAKAVVVGAVTFVTGLAAVVVAIPVAEHALRAGGNFIVPLPVLTEVRVVVGTAVLLALVAVLALAAGAILRSSAGAITAVIVVIVLPYFLAVASPVLSGAAADWLVRITPAAAFAIQQTVPQYAQVSATYMPFFGFFPLAPLAGFAVLCGWTAVALGLAVFLLRRRDA